MALDQHGARPLVTAVFGGPLPELGALVGGHRVNAILALLTAGDDPAFVEFAAGASAMGFTAFAAQAVEGALHHGPVALQGAERDRQGGVNTPELLAQGGELAVQSESSITKGIQIGKEKMRKK